MSEFTQGEWVYREYIPEGITLNGVEYLIHIEGEDDPEKDIALALKEADARLIAEAKNMYKQLKSTLYAIHEILPYIPDGINDIKVPVNKHDLLTEATLIEDILTRIDGDQEA